MWKHLIIDNFFDLEDYKKIIDLTKNIILKEKKNNGKLVFGTSLVNNTKKGDLLHFKILKIILIALLQKLKMYLKKKLIKT